MMYLSDGSRFWLVAFTLVAVYVASRVTNNAAKRLDFITSHRVAPPQQMVPVQQPDGSWNPIPWQTWQQPAPVEPPVPPPADFSFRLAKVWISMFLVVECPLLVLIVILEKTY